MQSCPDCLAELRPDPGAAADALGDILAAGGHLFRPDGVPAFAAGPECTVGRLAPRGTIAVLNGDGLVEASVEGAGVAAAVPLACCDLDGTVLFRLERYEAAEGAVVAVIPGGAAAGTYLRGEGGLDVRDGTSAPVARLEAAGGPGEWALVETGGRRLAEVRVYDEEQEGWVDDQWSLRPLVDRLPLSRLGAVGLVLAAKVLLGRTWPAEVAPRPLPQEEG